jgi:glycosyltransferase involved in cell wall biosynthesis
MSASAPFAVSVAMAVYNGEQYLSAQLESIAGQTRPPDELVITDNTSNDATPSIVAAFADKVQFRVVFRVNDRNLGVAKNFERAISYCTGDIIFLADADDVWVPHKIERQMAPFLTSDEVVLVLSDRELVNSRLEPLGQTWCQLTKCGPRAHRQIEQGKFSALLRTQLSGNSMAFRATLKKLLLPMEVDDWHDYWLGILAASFGKTVFIAEPLVKYRLHDNQNSGMKMAMMSRSSQLRHRFATTASLDESMLGVRILEKLLELKPSDADRIADVAAWAGHQVSRLGFASPETSRFRAIVGELVSARYSRYASGIFSAVKDLVPVRRNGRH